MSWGIVVEYDVRGLTHCWWMQRTTEDTLNDPREFDTEADAQAYIAVIIPYGCIFTPQELTP